MSNPPFKHDDDAEWSKVITAVLIKGATIICLDNVDGLLRSPSLASAITAKVYSGRILGFSKTAEIPVNVSWFVNGNNIQLGGDLLRRCYWIRLDAKMSRPWERKGFKPKDLGAWVMENRGQLIAAILTMARAWYVAGCPKPTTPKLGSFESWCDTVGGILHFAQIIGSLAIQRICTNFPMLKGRSGKCSCGPGRSATRTMRFWSKNWWRKLIRKVVQSSKGACRAIWRVL